jgi:hypothetical protein
LFAPHPQCSQRLALLIGQLAQRRLDPLAVQRQYLRIELIGY